MQLVEPLKKANDAGITVVCVDTFIGTGVYQTGAGDADFPISYIASDNVLGGVMAARALAKSIGEKGKVYVSNVKPGISTTDQREEGFKKEMADHPNIEVLETQFNDDDANKAASQVQAVHRPHAGTRRRVRRQPVLRLRHRQRRQAGRQAGRGQDRGLRRAEVGGPGTQERHVRRSSSPSTRPRSAISASSAAFAHLTGNPVPTLIGTGFTVMTKDNIDDPDVAKYLYTG